MFITETIENSEVTYIIDRETNTIKGFGGGKEAFEQYVYLAMQTERFKYPIFSNNYGFQSEDLISKNTDYIEAMIKKRASECLNDKRVKRLKEFEFDNSKNKEKEMSVKFKIDNVYGTSEYEVEI